MKNRSGTTEVYELTTNDRNVSDEVDLLHRAQNAYRSMIEASTTTSNHLTAHFLSVN